MNTIFYRQHTSRSIGEEIKQREIERETHNNKNLMILRQNTNKFTLGSRAGAGSDAASRREMKNFQHKLQ